MKLAYATDLKTAMINACEAIIAAEPELTRIDSIIGDGDHGIGMKTGFTVLRENLLETSFTTPYALFHAAGLCLVKCMGGSSGVLFGTLFISGLDVIQDKEALNAADIAAFLTKGIQGIIRRGRAKAGDKTMVDALLPAQAEMELALNSSDDIGQILKAAERGALNGVEATKSMVSRLGRSKNFREQAIGWPDPGAISVSILLGGLANSLSHD